MKPPALVLVLTLAACAHHPGDCALGLMDWDDCLPGTAGYAKHERSLAADDERCRSYGLAFGTPEYAACRESRDTARVGRSSVVLGAVLGAAVTSPRAVTARPVPAVASGGNCERGRQIRAVAEHGAVVVLNDSSVWTVGPDRVKTALWMPLASVLTCEATLVNLDTGEAAEARKVR